MKHTFWIAFALLGASHAQAQEAGPFERFLSPSSEECVKVKDIEAAAISFKPVKEPTFRFIQALYAAIPPMSKRLPPGDKGEVAIDKGGHIIAFLTDGDKSCARFLAPPFMAKMIEEVEKGGVEHPGDAL